MGNWKSDTKSKILDRLERLYERRETMKEAKEEAVRNSGQWCSSRAALDRLESEIEFLEDIMNFDGP